MKFAIGLRNYLGRLDNNSITFVILDYAAGRIADSLKRKGGVLIASSEGFFVNGREGPLKEEELEKAKKYTEDLVNKCREGI